MRTTLPDHPRASRRPRLRGPLRLALAGSVAGALALGVLSGVTPGSSPSDPLAAAPAAARATSTSNPVTPGDFTGYGFDQCLTPTQKTMDTWLDASPFLAVGIYLSGDSRACRVQPNLTKAWVSTQLAKGWRLLPITLGPQASCQPRFPRYSDDKTIDPRPGSDGLYRRARKMGQETGLQSVADAKKIGIVPGSTLWYDLEGFDSGNTACRESALGFISGWTVAVHAKNYVAGAYSSASSGIRVIDQARRTRTKTLTMPSRIWIADWNGKANTSSSYVPESSWRPGGRVKQYQGGHDETWGGVRINIDRNYLDLGKGSTAPRETHCGGVSVSFRSYAPLKPPTSSYTAPAGQVRAMQCLLTEVGLYQGKIDGRFRPGVAKAADRWHAKLKKPASGVWYTRDWMSLVSFGRRPVQKVGSAGLYVRRLQRALNAAKLGSTVTVDGLYDATTANLVRTYQRKVGLPVTGVVTVKTWTKFRSGAR